jgi:hypothetical protein
MAIICCILGCEKPPYRNGMCNAHRLRLKRHGTPVAGRRSPGSNNCGKDWCPAAKTIWKHVHYIQNSDTYKVKAQEWRNNNPEYYREKLSCYFSRPDVQEAARKRTKEWVKKNPERKRQMDREFAANNPSLVTSYKAKRRAAMLKAAPSWLTEEHHRQIKAVYAEARRLSEETGVPHEVDHIVPLQGKVVSGLHVPWNLRPLPRVENNRRPRIYSDKSAS